MSLNPINLAVRFLLELVSLFVLGAWGWRQRPDGWRFILALGIPLIMASIWAVFKVQGEPGSPGPPLVPVPGLLRLGIELAFFGLTVWALFDLGSARLGWVMGAVLLLHYLVSTDRIIWLLHPAHLKLRKNG